MEEQKTKLPLSVRKNNCISEMKDIMRLIGFWNVNKTQLARKHNVDFRSVDNWFTNLLSHIPPEKVGNIKIMGENSIKQAMAVCERILADPHSRTKEKLDAVNGLNDTLKHYTVFLEQYGMKPKIAESIDITGNLDINRLMAIAQKAKELKESEHIELPK